jgi:hypothetical protein
MTTRLGFRRPPTREAGASVARVPDEPHRRHFPVALATWAAGAGLFLSLAVAVTTAALSWPDEDIPPSVAADQQARTELAASQVRRALDGGLSDLAAVAAGIRALPAADTPNRLLSRLVATRARYRGAAYLAPTGEVRARAGADVSTTAPTAAPAVLVRAPRVFVSVPVTGARAGVLVAEITLDTLTTPLSLAGPGTTRLFDAGGRSIGAGPPNALAVALPVTRPGHALRHVDGRPATVTWAPVPGQGGLTVVTARPEPPRATERREVLLLGVLIATLTLVVFGWLHARVIGPLTALAKEADRLAGGDTGDPVTVRRYDRLGLIARDLEQVRRHLVGRN